MERLQDLLTLTFFLFYKNFSIKSKKLTFYMIGLASKKWRHFVEALLTAVVKHKNRSKLVARCDHTLYLHAYEFSCSSTPQSSQSFRSRIKNSRKFLPCLSGKALDVDSESVIILPRDMMRHSTTYYNHSDLVLALEGPQRNCSFIEQKPSSPTYTDESSMHSPVKCTWSPVGSIKEACRSKKCHATKSSHNRSGMISAMDSLWSSIGSKDEKSHEPDIDCLAEEFIQGFYQKLREQIF